ncbi:unnamed protein product [Adineta ricciae]|uniref:Fibronectin type-III domain-containing protein n=1 Tax=Adineta ricciae TaxID=249248 RepID=A0A814H6E7_ADIRI|nr:unnamed protein product [Adineta ricciae]CAF1005768.1 unnamed protein product [Adineta ricciae]
MRIYWCSLHILFLSIVSYQITPDITEPRITSIVPINSTALTVNWQFADTSIDRSDLIRISIDFYEYYYSYNRTYLGTNYTFVSTNKTITSLTKNFELVNAYYYVCFSSNSTVTNVSVYLAITNNCILARTCSRSNTTCSGPSSVLISSINMSPTAFLISFLWPNDLPYKPISFTANLINNNQSGTPLSVIQNSTHTNRSYLFNGLTSNTAYTVNTSFTYSALYNVTKVNTSTLIVTTSSSARIFYTGVVHFFWVIMFVLFFWE